MYIRDWYKCIIINIQKQINGLDFTNEIHFPVFPVLDDQVFGIIRVIIIRNK